jgi:hypothetical protein
MNGRLDDAQWMAAFAPKIGDMLTTSGGSTFVRLHCAGCALSNHPQPVWVQRGLGAAVCPKCKRRKREALEQPLVCMMRPNPNARRTDKSSEQFEGRWYTE